MNWLQWHNPEIPILWEAEDGSLKVSAQAEQLSDFARSSPFPSKKGPALGMQLIGKGPWFNFQCHTKRKRKKKIVYLDMPKILEKYTYGRND